MLMVAMVQEDESLNIVDARSKFTDIKDIPEDFSGKYETDAKAVNFKRGYSAIHKTEIFTRPFHRMR